MAESNSNSFISSYKYTFISQVHSHSDKSISSELFVFRTLIINWLSVALTRVSIKNRLEPAGFMEHIDKRIACTYSFKNFPPPIHLCFFFTLGSLRIIYTFLNLRCAQLPRSMFCWRCSSSSGVSLTVLESSLICFSAALLWSYSRRGVSNAP